MIFVDASALVAVLAKESDWFVFWAKIEASSLRYFSAISRWEAIAALRKSHGLPVDTAAATIDDFFETFAFQIVPIGDREGKLAEFAYKTYGRGRHPAALNMGDCFAYACAKSLGASLLYKGDDFAHTDLA